MKKLVRTFRSAFLAMIFGFCLAPAMSFAQNITLAWNPSVSSDVAGYKLYYQAGSADQPMEGIEALEGPSPIDVGDATTFTLTGLPEGSVYYFRATVYNSANFESDPSNLVASAWIPAPLLPENDSVANSPAMLVWSSPPADLDLTFTVLYGTDPALPVSGSIAAGGNNTGGLPPLGNRLAALVCLLVMGLRQLVSATARKRLAGLAVCVGLVLATVSCGGGGGGGGGDSPPSTTLSSSNDTVVVSGLTDNYLTTGDLDAGTTYYWKVLAVDGSGQEYESDTSSFTVE